MLEAGDVRSGGLQLQGDAIAFDGNLEAPVSMLVGAELPMLVLGQGGTGPYNWEEKNSDVEK
jgi:hypothetical protein